MSAQVNPKLRNCLYGLLRIALRCPEPDGLREQIAALGEYTDEELSRFSVARRYQLVQQCAWLYPAKPEEAKALVARLGEEYLAWFEYVLSRKGA